MTKLGSAFRSIGTPIFVGKLSPRKTPVAQTKEINDAWLCGFGLALAEVNRHYENVTVVNEVMRDAGVTPDMLITAGLDSYDLREIKKCWKQRPKSWRKRA